MVRRVVIFQPGSGTAKDRAASGKLRAGARDQGWEIVRVLADQPRDRGEARDTLWRDIAAGRVDMVAVPSLGALGGDVSEVLEAIVRLRDAGCDLYVEDASLDTSSPVDRVLFRIAEALRAIKPAAGRRSSGPRKIGKAKAQPEPTPGQRSLIQAALATGMKPRQVAKSFKLPVALVEAVHRDSRP